MALVGLVVVGKGRLALVLKVAVATALVPSAHSLIATATGLLRLHAGRHRRRLDSHRDALAELLSILSNVSAAD